jgi:hypothetical protein
MFLKRTEGALNFAWRLQYYKDTFPNEKTYGRLSAHVEDVNRWRSGDHSFNLSSLD